MLYVANTEAPFRRWLDEGPVAWTMLVLEAEILLHHYRQSLRLSLPPRRKSSVTWGGSSQRQGRVVITSPKWATYGDFLGTPPPLFPRTEEPLLADAWIRAIESKFAILAVLCPADRNAIFAAQQLRGAALLWWETTELCFLMIMWWIGKSLGLPSELTTFLMVWLRGSSMSSLLSLSVLTMWVCWCFSRWLTWDATG